MCKSSNLSAMTKGTNVLLISGICPNPHKAELKRALSSKSLYKTKELTG